MVKIIIWSVLVLFLLATALVCLCAAKLAGLSDRIEEEYFQDLMSKQHREVEDLDEQGN